MSQYVVTLSNGRSVRQFADNKEQAFGETDARLRRAGGGVRVLNVVRFEA